MIETPRISVIIPVYNGSRYLAQAIDSVLAQDYPNFEVLVVNDGSDDGGQTEALALGYGDRIRYQHKQNGGVATALNHGIRETTGAYLAWLSHDDVFLPGMLSRHVEALTRGGDENVVIYGDYQLIDEHGALLDIIRVEELDPRCARAVLLRAHPVNGCTTLIPRACLVEVGPYDEKLTTVQDYDMWFRLAAHYRFVRVGHPSVGSRQHAAQESRVNPVHKMERERLYLNALEQVPGEELRLDAGLTPISQAYLELAAALWSDKKLDRAPRRAALFALRHADELGYVGQARVLGSVAAFIATHNKITRFLQKAARSVSRTAFSFRPSASPGGGSSRR